MSTPSPDVESWPASARQFATTHWTTVLQARDGHSPEAAESLEKLCRTYWPPLYAFVRREGHAPPEAQDLTQAFFARMLERNYLSRLEHQQGRFRSFLLTFLKHFLAEQRGRARAQKRGGGQSLVSIDQFTEEERQLLEPADPNTPDQVYERRWAETVLRRALDRLQGEYEQAGQSALFERLKVFQPRDPAGLSQAEIGRQLGMSEVAVKSAFQRLRRRHSEILREEIAHTVTRPEEIDEEIRHLRKVLARAHG
jgi:RNA polymerase sigma-70 factor (ECF subfamily)